MLTIIFFLCSIQLVCIICEEKLFFSLTHFRHGARAPLTSSDSGKDYYGMKWENLGELTKVGQRMHYILGVYNRKRYIPKLISDKYDPSEIYVISSDFNRTFQSANSQLQGLYPFDKRNKLNDKQKENSFPLLPREELENIKKEIEELEDASLPSYMDVIPVHNFQQKDLIFINTDNPLCNKKSKELMIENVNDKIIVDRLEKFKKEWQPYFDKFFVGDNKKTYDYETVEKLADMFVTDFSEGFDFEDFKEKTKLNDKQMKELNEYFVEFVGRTLNNYKYGDKEGKLIKLDMSSLFKEMVEYIKRRINREFDLQEKKKIDYNDKSCPKLVMVSGHDSTVSSMMLFLGMMYGDSQQYWKVPAYAANVAFEVYNTKNTFSKDDYSQYLIRFYFNGELNKNDKNEAAEFNLKDFIERVDSIAWGKKEIDDFCGISNGSNGNNGNNGSNGNNGNNGSNGNIRINRNSGNNTNALAIVFGIITGVLLIAIAFLIIQMKKKPSTFVY